MAYENADCEPANTYIAIINAIRALEKELGYPNTAEVDERISVALVHLKDIKPLF